MASICGIRGFKYRITMDTERIFIKKQLEQSIALSEDNEISEMFRKRLGEFEKSFVENEDSLCNFEGIAIKDDEICQGVIEKMKHGNMLSAEVRSCIKQLSECHCALAMFLSAILVARLGDNYENASRALEYVEKACELEPYNATYTDFYNSLKQTLVSISNQRQRNAEARKQLAEEQRRYAEQQETERKLAQQHIDEERIKERNKKILTYVIVFVIIIIILGSCH